MDKSPYAQRHNDIFTLQSSSEDINFDSVIQATDLVVKKCFDNVVRPTLNSIVISLNYAMPYALIYTAACIIDPLDK